MSTNEYLEALNRLENTVYMTRMLLLSKGTLSITEWQAVQNASYALYHPLKEYDDASNG